MAADLQITAGLDASNVSAGLNKIGQGMKGAQAEAKGFSASMVSAGKAWAVSFAGNLASTAVSNAVAWTKKQIMDAVDDVSKTRRAALSIGLSTGDSKKAMEDITSLANEMGVEFAKVAEVANEIQFRSPNIEPGKLKEVVKAGLELERIRGIAGNAIDATEAVENLAGAFQLSIRDAEALALQLTKMAGLRFTDMTQMVEKLSTKEISPEGILAFNVGMQRGDVQLRKSLPILQAIVTNMDKLKQGGFDVSKGLPNLIEQLNNAQTVGEREARDAVLSADQQNILRRGDVGAMMDAAKTGFPDTLAADSRTMREQTQKNGEYLATISNNVMNPIGGFAGSVGSGILETAASVVDPDTMIRTERERMGLGLNGTGGRSRSIVESGPNAGDIERPEDEIFGVRAKYIPGTADNMAMLIDTLNQGFYGLTGTLIKGFGDVRNGLR